MCGEKLLVSSLLQDPAARQHDDVICVLDGGEAVCHDEHGADAAHLFQRVLDQDLGLGINVGRCFVQDHDARLMQQGAGKVLALGGYTSLAARRELHLLEIDLLRLNASPGGAADLLAATIFVDRVEREHGE